MTYLNELKQKGRLNKALVIAPKRVAEDTWSREHEKWDHLGGLTRAKILGTAKERAEALKENADIYIINRENVVWLIDELKGEWPFNIVVIDELSSFKSPQAKRWRYLKRVIKLSDIVIGLTGTPAPNGYLDLWPEMFLIDGGEALGRTLTGFRDMFFVPGARKGHIVYEWLMRRGAKDRIDAKLKPRCLSMSKEDWLELPPINFNNVHVRMDSKERKTYEQLEKDQVIPLLKGKVSSLEDMDSAVLGATAATVSNKLLQMANGAVYDNEKTVFKLHDKKLDALDEIREANAGEPILCFYSYKHDLDRILERNPDARKLDTADDIKDWNEGKISLALCHPASAGHGLNLQEGGHVAVWFGLPWSLELYQQANARLYRQGQEHPVMVHHILCDDTIDERVLRVLQNKDSTQRSLLEALKGYMNNNEKG